MLNIILRRGEFIRIAIAAALIPLTTSCAPFNPKEEIFSLYIGKNNYDKLVSSLQNYSNEHSFRITFETVEGNRPETTARHIMVDGDGVRALIQSALAEQCEEREGRRDVEYSFKVFDVNVFSTSYFTSNEKLLGRAEQLKSALTAAGFRILSKHESCALL